MAKAKIQRAQDEAFLKSVDPGRVDAGDCRALWSSVIKQAIADCRVLVRGTSYAGMRNDAESSARWLKNAGKDFREVLLMAGIDESAATVLSELGQKALDGDKEFVEEFYGRMKNTV